jgi:hypothetical protein
MKITHCFQEIWALRMRRILPSPSFRRATKEPLRCNKSAVSLGKVADGCMLSDASHSWHTGDYARTTDKLAAIQLETKARPQGMDAANQLNEWCAT